jgi:hypothetical protein
MEFFSITLTKTFLRLRKAEFTLYYTELIKENKEFMHGLGMAYPLPTFLPTQPTPSGSSTEISAHIISLYVPALPIIAL